MGFRAALLELFAFEGLRAAFFSKEGRQTFATRGEGGYQKGVLKIPTIEDNTAKSL